MPRPLTVVTGLSCVLFVLCLVANVVAIRGATASRDLSSDASKKTTRILAPTDRLGEEHPDTRAGSPARARDRNFAPVQERAEASVRAAVRELLGPLAPLAQNARTSSAAGLTELGLEIHAQLMLHSKERNAWMTRTEVRVPCARLDDLLAKLADPDLGRPRHCERWVEATAERLEAYGVREPSAREFLDEYGGDRTIRVLWVYAGWRPANDAKRRQVAAQQIELIASHPAPIFPEREFGVQRRRALDEIYAELELGPHRREESPEAG